MKMIKKMAGGLLLGSFLLLGGGNDDAFLGTWKLNTAVSRITKGHPEAKNLTLVVTKEGEVITVTLKGVIGDQPISQKWAEPSGGGTVNFIEGAPPEGVKVTTKLVNDRTVDTTTMNGKHVIMTQHTVVSEDHKTMTVRESGTDEKGPFKIFAVYDRQ